MLSYRSPKFLLRAPRKLSIRLHVLSGTVEIISFVVVWCWGLGGTAAQDATWRTREQLTRVQCLASMVHLATALYQTPIVFGTQVRALHFPLSHSFSHTNLKSPCAEQAVMIPAYLGCILAKSACTWDLWYNLNCARKCLRLYNILSIYTWCRVFIGLFGRTVMFQDSLYSVSILLAGAVCLPSMGPGMMCIAFLVIGAYQLSVYSFGSDHFKATQL